MPRISANNCEMHYEVDDYTDPWLKDKDTIWLQHGVGRSSKFWYHWVPALGATIRSCAVTCADMGSPQVPDPTTRGQLTSCSMT